MRANLHNSGALQLIDYTEFLQPSSVRAYFTTRYGGISRAAYSSLNLGLYTGDKLECVNQNYQILRNNLPDKERMLYTKQVHGKSIFIDDGKTSGLVGEYDGLISCHDDVMLLTYHADCLPVYATVTNTDWFGVVHSGWKGTYAKIANRLIETLLSCSGADVEQIRVVIGPGIAKRSYQVNKALYQQFIGEFGSSVVSCQAESYLVDLSESIAKGLEAINLSRAQISIEERDTYSDESLFSYRRQGAESGRMAAIIMRNGA